jgi:hypothetical protein
LNLKDVFSAQQQKQCSNFAHDENFSAQAPANRKQWAEYALSPLSLDIIPIFGEN